MIKKLIATTALLTSLAGCTTYKYIPTDTSNSTKYSSMLVKKATEPQPVFKTDKTGSSLLYEVNTYVNSRLTYKEEPKGVDVWQTPAATERTHTGDCEDYAIYKAELLEQNGVNPSDMSIVVGYTADGVTHAVLKVTLNKSTFYLDNRDYSIRGNSLDSELYEVNPDNMTVIIKK